MTTPSSIFRRRCPPIPDSADVKFDLPMVAMQQLFQLALSLADRTL
jgi:hypothetical protein